MCNRKEFSNNYCIEKGEKMKYYKLKIIAVALASTMLVGCSNIVNELASNLTVTTNSDGDLKMSIISDEIKSLMTRVEYGTNNLESYQYKITTTSGIGEKNVVKGVVDLKNRKAEYTYTSANSDVQEIFDMSTNTLYTKNGDQWVSNTTTESEFHDKVTSFYGIGAEFIPLSKIVSSYIENNVNMNKLVLGIGVEDVELVVGDDGYIYSTFITKSNETLFMEFWGFNKTVLIKDPKNDSILIDGLKGIINMFQ